MAATPYTCSNVHGEVRVLTELIVYEDRKLSINTPSIELRHCSHVAQSGCPVRNVATGEDDVKGWNLADTKHCEYLKQERQQWSEPNADRQQGCSTVSSEGVPSEEP